ncbi:MAG: phosphotransferase [archaeon]
MKLEKKQIQKIFLRYNLGNVLSYSKAERGVVNHNWVVTTDKGKFVLRGLTKFRRKRELLYEHQFLKKVSSRNIPYRLPFPCKIGRSTFLKYKGIYFWIYNFIEGTHISKLYIRDIKEIAKAMSIFHKKSNNIKITAWKNWPNAFQTEWLFKQYKKIRRQIINNSKKDNFGRYFLKNINTVETILKTINPKGYYRLKRFPVHSDLTRGNLIFNKKRKLVGIIDFDSIRRETKIRDITQFIIWECRPKKERYKLNYNRVKIFLKAYRKYNKLSNYELKFLLDIAISEFSDTFYWFYHVHYNYNDKKVKLRTIKIIYKSIIWYYENKGKIIKRLLEL